MIVYRRLCVIALCEHAFVSYGEHLGRFQKAIENSDATAAMAAARDMGTVGLYDALSLCRLLAETRDPLFERAAKRWLTMLAGEGRQGLADVQTGATALVALHADPEDEAAFEILERLVQYRGE